MHFVLALNLDISQFQGPIPIMFRYQAKLGFSLEN